jgi:hypothetical protein
MNSPQKSPTQILEVNVASNSLNPTEALLSNLAHTPFVLD